MGLAISTLPKDLKAHRNITKVYDARKEAIQKEGSVDWGFAEALAFGTLIAEGAPLMASRVLAFSRSRT